MNQLSLVQQILIYVSAIVLLFFLVFFIKLNNKIDYLERKDISGREQRELQKNKKKLDYLILFTIAYLFLMSILYFFV